MRQKSAAENVEEVYSNENTIGGDGLNDFRHRPAGWNVNILYRRFYHTIFFDKEKQ